jgi:hypothetical protein
VELGFKWIDSYYRQEIGYFTLPKITPDEAIDELNARFREHGVGYQYESGNIIRVDSQIIHSEAVKPVLHLLSDDRFKARMMNFCERTNTTGMGATRNVLTTASKLSRVR